MLEPSAPFYAALFGAMRMGAVAVPLFTLFGPDGVRLRFNAGLEARLAGNCTAAEAHQRSPADALRDVVADADGLDRAHG